MTSSSDWTCDPRFPAAGALLDNSALVRLWKCEALDVLAGTVALHVAGQVAREFRAQGPAERAALDRLGVIAHRVAPGQSTWDTFCRLRGGQCSTRDLGEDESLAVALTMAEGGTLLPFVTYDCGASSDAIREGVVILDFLDTLAWLVGCGVLSAERADALEQDAGSVDGWKRPPGYTGAIESVRSRRQVAVVARVEDWRRQGTTRTPRAR